MTNSLADLATEPASLTISTFEGPLTIAVDTALRLANGQSSPISPTVRLLINNDSGKEITLADAATVSGTQVLQPIRGSALTADYEYLLVVTFGDGAGNTQSSFTSVFCPI